MKKIDWTTSKWPLAAFLFLTSLAGGSVLADDAAPAAPAAKPAAADVAIETPDPAVEAIVAADPKEPAAILRASLALLDLGRPEMARGFFQRLLQLRLKSDGLADLVRDVGSDKIIRLTRIKDFGPAAGIFARNALEAADARNRDPGRVAGLVKQLSEGSAESRRLALVDLKQANYSAVGALLSVLADGRREAEHRSAAEALVEMGPLAAGPLLGALETTDREFLARLLPLLTEIEVPGAAYYLIGPALDDAQPALRDAARATLGRLLGVAPPSPRVAVLLEKRLRELVAGEPALPLNHEQRVSVWSWDDAKKELREQFYPSGRVGVLLGARIARDVYRLSPENSPSRHLAIAVLLEAERARLGVGPRLSTGASSPRALAAAQPAEMESVLRTAIERALSGAAVEMIDLLAASGRPDLFDSRDGRPTVMASALAHPDARVRLAAARAVVALDAHLPFAGSSEFLPTLARLVRSAGPPVALVAHERVRDAQDVAGLLLGAGYRAASAASGRELLQLAQTGGEPQLIFLSLGIDRYDVRETLYRLRRDPRTASVPVCLLSTLENHSRGEAIAAEHRLTIVQVRPADPEAMHYYLEELTTRRGLSPIGDAERQAMAREALNLVGRLVDSGRYAQDLRAISPTLEGALATAELSPLAAPIVAKLGTATGQSALVDVASRPSVAPEIRLAAARAFVTAVERHRILLTTHQIDSQYQRYNASESADPQTQRVLAMILDAIEAPLLAEQSAPRPTKNAD